jgi:cytochrome c oxidase cbb3-type subunit 2/cytochrome c oxidase cbb3-type subunit I/II
MSASSGRAVRMSYLVASIAGVAFFVMSVALLGIWPGRVLGGQIAAMAPDSPLPLTRSEQRGRVVYAREGCAYCHTQQVRYLEHDVRRFGPATLAWETRLDYPHLMGTRRIGPDLSRQSGVRTADWHFLHLFNPRAVVPESVMPPYRALFDGAPDRPRQEARDLVAYLESLGRARAIAGPEGEAAARAGCDCAGDAMAELGLALPGPTATPARPRRGDPVPSLQANADGARGQLLYDRRCASCHGPLGAGDGPAARWLSPRPANLAAHEYTMARLEEALWNGVPGTAMQAWRDHSLDDLASLATVVRAFQLERRDPPLPDTQIETGRRVYADNCEQCHGPDGGGDGWAAAELAIAPTDFGRQRPSIAHSVAVVRDGVEGTRMAPWTSRLTEEEIAAAALYVRELFERDAVAPEAAP